MPTPREKLIEELKDKVGAAGTGFIHSTVEAIADLVIEDRKRICAPLVKWDELDKRQMTCNGQLNSLWEAKTEVLTLALLDKEGLI